MTSIQPPGWPWPTDESRSDETEHESESTFATQIADADGRAETSIAEPGCTPFVTVSGGESTSRQERDAEGTPVSGDKDAGETPDETRVTDLRKRELVEAVVARSGVRKRDARPAVNAALRVMGEALAEGRDLNLLPFGKVKVTRRKDGPNGQVFHIRLRQPEDALICLRDPLAQAAE